MKLGAEYFSRASRLPAHLVQVWALIAGDYSTILGGAVDETTAGQFRGIQIDVIRRSTPGMSAANAFNTCVLLLSLWNTAFRPAALWWAAGALMIMLLMAGPILRPRRASSRELPVASRQTIWRVVRNSFLVGCLWGIAPILFYSGAPAQARFVIVCLCAGVVGGGAMALASVPAAVIALSVPLVSGSLFAIFRESGWDALLAAGLIACYGSFVVHMSISHALALVSRHASRIELERLARRDPLTDLPNLGAFRDEVARAEARLVNSGAGYSVLCIDIDQLRDINKRLGYAAGDRVLQMVAARLRETARVADVVARIEGDQFAVLVNQLAADATVRAYANRMQASLMAPYSLPGGEASLTASIGVSVARSVCGENHLRNATLALAAAQGNGRGQTHVYTIADGDGARARELLAADLCAAMHNGHLQLHYQPFLDIATGSLSGFEALLRWRHPLRGEIYPPDIIAVAEEQGLIEALGAWVLGEACRAAAGWPDTLRVAVNISPLQLRSRALSETVAAVLAASRLPARRLEIEVTENALIADQDLARHVLSSLRDTGVQLALDDFGTGFSSLNYLWSLPFDRIKIDRSFISESSHNPDAASIVRAILTLARDLRLDVTAEGVETARQLAFLREHGCADAQGYYIGKAMPETEAARFVESWSGRAAA